MALRALPSTLGQTNSPVTWISRDGLWKNMMRMEGASLNKEKAREILIESQLLQMRQSAT